MALSATQKAQIRFYLGFPDQFRDVNTSLEGQFNQLSPEAETLITAALTASPAGILTSLIDIDAKLVTAHARLKAVKVGSIELPKEGEIVMLRSEGRRLVMRLSIMFSVPIMQDVFSDDPPGSGLSGGVIPLG